MRSEIVSIGTEILMGQIADTNSSWIAQQLPALGIDLYWISTVGDNRERLTEVLGRAFARSDLVICTGGLGPTEDDVTRESIAAMLGEEMFVDPDLEAGLRAHFGRRGNPMPERNVKQATRTKSVASLPNPNGTAPGWWVERPKHILVAMPGVPHEMRRMWEFEVVPRLRSKLSAEIIHSRVLKVIGLGESAAEEKIRDLVSSVNPTIGTYAKEDGVHLRLTAKAASLDKAERLVADMEEKVRRILGIYIYGADEETLPGVLGKLLVERGLSLATMESCTGGQLSSAITDTPGSSNYFKGGLVAYSNEAKIAFGVSEQIIRSHGAVSVETAVAMASAARKTFNASVGLSVTGVAGPDEQEGKPVGTVHLGIDLLGETSSISPFFPVARTQMKRLSMLTALDLARRTLLKDPAS